MYITDKRESWAAQKKLGFPLCARQSTSIACLRIEGNQEVGQSQTN